MARRPACSRCNANFFRQISRVPSAAAPSRGKNLPSSRCSPLRAKAEAQHTGCNDDFAGKIQVAGNKMTVRPRVKIAAFGVMAKRARRFFGATDARPILREKSALQPMQGRVCEKKSALQPLQGRVCGKKSAVHSLHDRFCRKNQRCTRCTADFAEKIGRASAERSKKHGAVSPEPVPTGSNRVEIADFGGSCKANRPF